MKIPLTQGHFVEVDPCDYDELSKVKWTFMSSSAKAKDRVIGYAYRKVRKKSILMHRVILGAKPGQDVDHKNGCGLDNRRKNLRLCSRAENSWNSRRNKPGKSSKYIGVHWCNTTQRWVARIRAGTVRLCLGYFRDEMEAAKAYKVASTMYHGNFRYQK